jgi:hypothetical protein
MKHPEESPGGRNANQYVNSKKTTNKISQPKADEPMDQKRSNNMKHTSFAKSLSRGISVLLTIALIATMAFGQNLIVNNSSTYAGSGTFNVGGDIKTDGLTVDKTIGASGSKVYLTKNGTQTIGGQSGTSARTLSFYTLEAQGGNTKTQGLQVDVITGFDIKNTSTYAVADRTLTLEGTVATTSGSLTTAASSTVDYNAGGQAVISTAYNGTLKLTAGAKTLAGNVTANILNQVAGSITIGHTLGVTTDATFQTITDLASTLTLGSGTSSIATLTDNTAGTITGGSGPLTFSGAAKNSSTITGGSGLVKFSSTLVQAAGTITAGSGKIEFDNTVTRDGGSIASSASANVLEFKGNVSGTVGTIDLTGTGAAEFGGSISSTTGLSFPSGTFVTYNGGSAQAIADMNYGNLILKSSTKSWTLGAARTISNTLDVQASSATQVDGSFDLNVGGNITIASTLTKSNNAVALANASSTVSGAGEIAGSVTRTNMSAGTAYAFNNEAMTVKYTGGTLTSFTMASLPGTNPTTGYLLDHSVKRNYTPTFTGTTSNFEIQLGYLNAEAASATQARLRDFANGIAKGNVLSGTYSRGTSSNGFKYVDLTGQALTSGHELALDDRFYQFKSFAAGSTHWDVAGTWDALAVPTAFDEVIIDNNFPVLIPDSYAASALSVTINATSTGLTVGQTATGATLAVGTGGLTNNSTGTGLTVIAGSSVTITGGDLTNNGAVTNAGTITVQ